MKIFGKIEEITQVILRKASRKVTIDPATQTVGDATLTVPDLAGVNRALVTDSSTQTLTNKTLTSPAISSPTGLVKGDVGLGNVDNTSDATKNAAAVTLTNKKLDDTTTRVVDTSDPTVELEFDVTGTAGTKTKLFTSQTANRNIVLPDAAGTIGLVPSAGPVRSSGTSLTTGATDLASEVTGTLLLGNGGTGQTTASAAFTALSPTTTTGDLIYRDGGSHDRLAIGSEGKVLTSVGGLPSWQFPAGGSGEINVIENSSAANAITGWVASGAGITVARTTTASDLPLEGPVDSAIKITPVSGTDYVRYRWTMPAALKNKKLKLEWHQRPLSGYASGDLKVEVYKNSLSDYTGSYTEFALSTDSSGTSAIPNATGKYTTTYDSDDADYYELRIVRVAGTTALNITNVISGPGIQPQGAVVGPVSAITFPTPTNLGTGSATNTATGYRDGEVLHVKLRCVKDGSSGSGASLVTFTMPSGYTIATGLLPPNWPLGSGSFSGATYGPHVDVIATSSTTFQIRKNGAATNFTGADFTAGGDLNLVLQIPITEWAGSGVVNLAQNDVEYAYNTSTADTSDTSSFGFGPDGGLVPSTLTTAKAKRVRFSTPIQATDNITLEIKSNSNAPWVTFIGDEDQGVSVYGVQNTATYGIGLRYITGSPTDVDVYFGQYAQANGTTFGSAGRNWSSPNSGGMRWRLKKSSGGQAVGFGLATATQSGLISREDSGTFTANFTGPFSKSVSIRYRRFGKLVTLDIPEVTDTSTVAAYLIASGAIPAAIRPALSVHYVPVFVRNNSADVAQPGYLTVHSNGDISVRKSFTDDNFTNTGTVGGPRGSFAVSYAID